MSSRKRKFRTKGDAASDGEDDPGLFSGRAGDGGGEGYPGSDDEAPAGAGTAAPTAAASKPVDDDDDWEQDERARQQDQADKSAFEARMRARDEAKTRKLAGEDSRKAASDRAALLT